MSESDKSAGAGEIALLARANRLVADYEEADRLIRSMRETGDLTAVRRVLEIISNGPRERKAIEAELEAHQP